MATPPVGSYAHDIDNTVVIADVPAVLKKLDLNCEMATGSDPIPDNLTHGGLLAAATPVYTSNLHQDLALLTASIHNCFDQLGAKLNILGDKWDALHASMDANMRAIRRNSRQPPSQVEPLQKTKRSHGFKLAQALARGLDPTGLQDLVAPLNPPAIGATPPAFRPDIPNYQHRDILEMVIFYNDDFGILPTDTVGSRRKKFHGFLVGR